MIVTDSNDKGKDLVMVFLKDLISNIKLDKLVNSYT